MAFYTDLIESAATLKGVVETFEHDLRAGLKVELMRLAEERIDVIVDDTVKSLQTRVDGMRDAYAGQSLIKITVNRMTNAPPPRD